MTISPHRSQPDLRITDPRWARGPLGAGRCWLAALALLLGLALGLPGAQVPSDLTLLEERLLEVLERLPEPARERFEAYFNAPEVPVVRPDSGTYQRPVRALLLPRPFLGMSVRYTLDGSEPTAESPRATRSLLFTTGTVVLKARTVSITGALSPVVERRYVIEPRNPDRITATPEIASPGGTYHDTVLASATSDTDGAELRYTLDGSVPDRFDPLLEDPITIAESGTLLTLRAFARGMLPSGLAQAEYTLQVATPALQPEPGSFSSTQSVVATTATPDAILRYTTDGSAPTATSPTVPADGIPVEVSTEVQVRGFRAGFDPSSVAGGLYELVVPDPTIDLAAGTYHEELLVPVTVADGATAHYTLDGSAPTAASPTVPVDGVAIIASATLSVIAIREGWTSSAVVSAAYELQALPPSFDPVAGSYSSEQAVTLSTPTADAEVRFARDGSDPTNSSELADGPVTVDISQTLTARAFRSGWTPSEPASASYELVVPDPTIDLAAGTYNDELLVPVTVADGATAHYTLDGTAPTADSPTVPVDGVALTESATLSIIAIREGWTSSAVVTAAYELQALPPSFDPVAGSYSSEQAVTLSTPTADAEVRFTRDGTDPTASSELADGPVTVDVSQTLTARAFRSGWTPSEPASASYELIVPDPTIDLAAGTYNDELLVPVTVADGATAHYTLDGSAPTADSPTVPVDGVAIIESATLSIIAVREGWTSSAVVSAAYELQALPPSFDPVAGSYSSEQAVTLSTPTADAEVRFTRDGTDPTASSELADGPVTVDVSQTLTARAFRSGWTASEAASASYELVVPDPTIDLAAGTYNDELLVPVTVADGATAHYTLDGTAPTADSPTVPVDGVAIIESATLSIIAVREGWTSSAVVSAAYELQALPPSFDPVAGSYSSEQAVTLSTPTADAEVRFTRDGTDPTNSSELADGPVTVDISQTLTARAFRSGWTPSEAASASYELVVPGPSIDLAAGTYTDELLVPVIVADGATAHYTLDGSAPTAASPTVPADGVAITESATLSVIAVREGWTFSAVVSAVYELQVATPILSPSATHHDQAVTLTAASASSGAVLRVTTDGSLPEADSAVLPLEGLSLTQAGTHEIAVRGFRSGWEPSEVVSRQYVLAFTDEPTVRWTSESLMVQEQGDSLVLTAILATPLDEELVVPLSLDTSSSTADADDVALPAAIRIPAGETLGRAAVPLTQEGADEGIETLVVELLPGEGYLVAAPERITVTIDDRLPAPRVTYWEVTESGVDLFGEVPDGYGITGIASPGFPDASGTIAGELFQISVSSDAAEPIAVDLAFTDDFGNQGATGSTSADPSGPVGSSGGDRTFLPPAAPVITAFAITGGLSGDERFVPTEGSDAGVEVFVSRHGDDEVPVVVQVAAETSFGSLYSLAVLYDGSRVAALDVAPGSSSASGTLPLDSLPEGRLELAVTATAVNGVRSATTRGPEPIVLYVDRSPPALRWLLPEGYDSNLPEDASPVARPAFDLALEYPDRWLYVNGNGAEENASRWRERRLRAIGEEQALDLIIEDLSGVDPEADDGVSLRLVTDAYSAIVTSLDVAFLPPGEAFDDGFQHARVTGFGGHPDQVEFRDPELQRTVVDADDAAFCEVVSLRDRAGNQIEYERLFHVWLDRLPPVAYGEESTELPALNLVRLAGDVARAGLGESDLSAPLRKVRSTGNSTAHRLWALPERIPVDPTEDAVVHVYLEDAAGNRATDCIIARRARRSVPSPYLTRFDPDDEAVLRYGESGVLDWPEFIDGNSTSRGVASHLGDDWYRFEDGQDDFTVLFDDQPVTFTAEGEQYPFEANFDGLEFGWYQQDIIFTGIDDSSLSYNILNEEDEGFEEAGYLALHAEPIGDGDWIFIYYFEVTNLYGDASVFGTRDPDLAQERVDDLVARVPEHQFVPPAETTTETRTVVDPCTGEETTVEVEHTASHQIESEHGSLYWPYIENEELAFLGEDYPLEVEPTYAWVVYSPRLAGIAPNLDATAREIYVPFFEPDSGEARRLSPGIVSIPPSWEDDPEPVAIHLEVAPPGDRENPTYRLGFGETIDAPIAPDGSVDADMPIDREIMLASPGLNHLGGPRWLNLVGIENDIQAAGAGATLRIHGGFVDPASDLASVDGFGSEGVVADLRFTSAESGQTLPAAGSEGIEVLEQRLVATAADVDLRQILEVDVLVGADVPAHLYDVEIDLGAVREHRLESALAIWSFAYQTQDDQRADHMTQSRSVPDIRLDSDFLADISLSESSITIPISGSVYDPAASLVEDSALDEIHVFGDAGFLGSLPLHRRSHQPSDFVPYSPHFDFDGSVTMPLVTGALAIELSTGLSDTGSVGRVFAGFDVVGSGHIPTRPFFRTMSLDLSAGLSPDAVDVVELTLPSRTLTGSELRLVLTETAVDNLVFEDASGDLVLSLAAGIDTLMDEVAEEIGASLRESGELVFNGPMLETAVDTGLFTTQVLRSPEIPDGTELGYRVAFAAEPSADVVDRLSLTLPEAYMGPGADAVDLEETAVDSNRFIGAVAGNSLAVSITDGPESSPLQIDLQWPDESAPTGFRSVFVQDPDDARVHTLTAIAGAGGTASYTVEAIVEPTTNHSAPVWEPYRMRMEVPMAFGAAFVHNHRWYHNGFPISFIERDGAFYVGDSQPTVFVHPDKMPPIASPMAISLAGEDRPVAGNEGEEEEPTPLSRLLGRLNELDQRTVAGGYIGYRGRIFGETEVIYWVDVNMLDLEENEPPPEQLSGTIDVRLNFGHNGNRLSVLNFDFAIEGYDRRLIESRWFRAGEQVNRAIRSGGGYGNFDIQVLDVAGELHAAPEGQYVIELDRQRHMEVASLISTSQTKYSDDQDGWEWFEGIPAELPGDVPVEAGWVWAAREDSMVSGDRIPLWTLPLGEGGTRTLAESVRLALNDGLEGGLTWDDLDARAIEDPNGKLPPPALNVKRRAVFDAMVYFAALGRMGHLSREEVVRDFQLLVEDYLVVYTPDSTANVDERFKADTKMGRLPNRIVREQLVWPGYLDLEPIHDQLIAELRADHQEQRRERMKRIYEESGFQFDFSEQNIKDAINASISVMVQLGDPFMWVGLLGGGEGIVLPPRPATWAAVGANVTGLMVGFAVDKITFGVGSEAISLAKGAFRRRFGTNLNIIRRGDPPNGQAGRPMVENEGYWRNSFCFAPGTQVLTDVGLVPIEDIQVGDRVWARSEDGTREGWRPVLDTVITRPRVMARVTYVYRAGNQRGNAPGGEDGEGVPRLLEVTPEHFVWSASRGRWLTVDELEPGDAFSLRGEPGLQAVVQGVDYAFASGDESYTAHNLTIAEFKTYFVLPAGESSAGRALWVHNEGRSFCSDEGIEKARLRYRQADRDGQNPWLIPELRDAPDHQKYLIIQGGNPLRRPAAGRIVPGDELHAGAGRRFAIEPEGFDLRRKVWDAPVKVTQVINGRRVTVIYKQNGMPDFRPFADRVAKQHGLQPNQTRVRIDLDRRLGRAGRDADDRAADAASGIPNAAQFRRDNQLTWHHSEELGVMELVPRMINREFPHTGGRAIHETLVQEGLR